MAQIDSKQNIQLALAAFKTGSLSQNAITLFDALGYNTTRQQPFEQKTWAYFNDYYVSDNSNFNAEAAKVSQWQSIDLLFQLSKDEVSDEHNVFITHQVEQTIIESYLFFALELKSTAYTRTELAQVTREINKVFSMPAMILFKYGDNITLSVINRRLHKTNVQKDVLEKVTLIKDIAINQTHRAHIDILFDLSFIEIKRVDKVSNFVELHNAWQKILDTKQLNKKFYKELRDWYFWAINEVVFPIASFDADDLFNSTQNDKVREHNAKNLIRLLTRILFVWFIKEKDLIPDELFDESYIKTYLIKDFDPHKEKNYNTATQRSEYYRAILQNLFFASLNQTCGQRKFRNRGQNMNVTNLMRYESYFKDPQAFLKLIEDKVPFMNGGLFECLDKPDPLLKGRQGGDVILYEDGFSDRPDNQLRVPDYIFFDGDQHADLSEELGDRRQNDVPVKGLINILKAYKFTVTENTPIEEDIALDPELLGQVFENLLASYNPETKTTARKQTGSFYTPREIVDYMVDESLIAYLSGVEAGGQALPDSGEACTPKIDKLRSLLSYNDLPNPFNETETTQLITAIDTCKILDPACGSGAFPMGILHKMVHILHKLDPQNQRWQERQLEKARLIDDDAIRDQLLEDIEAAFNNNELDYGRKLYLIENCIYGVDIQPIATQISKLRFFISLIVDQKSDRTKDNFGIRPLPNLEAKFVAANTLIGIDKPKTGINADSTRSLFENKEIEALENQLKDVRHYLFSAKTPKYKRELRVKDEALRKQIGELLKEQGWGNVTAQQLANWSPYDQNASADFFDNEWMFGISDGFDIVIGNPPYMRVQTLQLTQSASMPIYRKEYKSAVGSFDIYALFVEKGYTLLNKNGQLSFILPHKFFQATFGVGLRKLLTQRKALQQIVRFGAEQVFDEATTYTCLLFLASQPQEKFNFVEIKSLETGNDVLIAAKNRTTHNDYSCGVIDAPKNETWNFSLGKSNLVMERLLEHKQTLGDITRKIFVGLQTSADKIYVLRVIEDKGNIIRCYSKQLDKEIEIEKGLTRTFLMGKDVHRYQPAKAINIVIFPYLLVNNKAILMTQDDIKTKFPLGWQYLIENHQLLSDREKGKMHGDRFYAYIYPKNLTEFDAVKLMTPDICAKPEMTIDESADLYHTTTIYSFVFNEKAKGSVKYYLGLLNSKVMWYFQTITGNVLRGGFLRFKTEYLKPFPIPESNIKQQKAIELLVEYILYITKQPFYTSTDLAYAEERLMVNFLENLINAMVYELYFPDELHEAGKYFISLIEKENLPDLNTIQADKLSVLKKITQRLTDKDHPLYVNLFFLDSVSVVRVIEGKE